MARTNPPGPFELSVALPSVRNNQGCTSMHFGENQLLPNSISFSLLTTGHPRLFQQALVRSSMGFHPHFKVIQDFFNRHWFGPPWGFTPTSTCPWLDRQASGLLQATSALFGLAFASAPELASLNLAAHNISPAHFSIGTLSLSIHRCTSSSNCL